MKSLFTILFVLLIASADSCGDKPVTNPEEYTKRQIIFGSGGGFTGQVVQYNLLSNGQLFKRTYIPGKENIEDSGYEAIKVVAKEKVKEVMSELDALNPASLTLNESGNMYYFLEDKTGIISHKLTWIDYSEKAPKELKALFGKLKNLTLATN